MSAPRIAIFVSFSGQGGVERMITNLASGLLAQGVALDLVLAKAQGEHLQHIPANARVIRLDARHTSTSLLGLVRYLRRERPQAVLAAKDRAIKTAILARWLSGTRPRLVGRLGTTVSAALEGKGRLRRAIWFGSMRLFYRWVDAVIAVSEGVAEDVAAISRLPRGRIHVVRNPVITPDLARRAAEPVEDPWFAPGEPPVILGVGRLTLQKDFPTLVRAFARLRREREARLVILGSGGERAREELRRLARELGVEADLKLPGFHPNPYAHMARAGLFVLSSAWEGSPNVLTEAMAVGTPVVATDCPSGPREILQAGRYGPLVPVGDAEAMAQAMLRVLADPPSPDSLRAAVAEYTVERSAERYRAILEDGDAG